MRWLLVQAAWCILRRRKRPQTAALPRLGGSGLPAGVAGPSPWWRWRDVWRGSSLRSGGMGLIYDATKVRGPLPARRAA